MAKSLTVEKQFPISISWRQWIRSLWLELRPEQWVKNLLVLAPLLFSRNLFNPLELAHGLGAFVFFCLISSSVYLLNDIQDYEEDRLHPQKRHRPLAAGHISIRTAVQWMVVLLLLGLVGSMMLNYTLFLILTSYWLINLLYSTYLKDQVILDVFAIASGFVLRVVGGGVAIQIRLEETSPWLILCTTLLALFLGFSKRRHEIVLLGEDATKHRRVLKEYGIHFLDMMIAIVTASTVMSYALYTLSEETVQRFQTRGLLLTLPFVLYGIFRYLYLIYHKNQGGNPTRDLLTDRSIMVNVFLWALGAGIILYWK